tara:strand:+ start:191 stop:397 length:207 start_codon:yes stop_codon:yes gene_type:complete
MKSQDQIVVRSKALSLSLVLEIVKEKIFEHQQGKEEIDQSLVDALYWIERGLNTDGDYSIKVYPDPQN